ncbi:hypothetical protein [Pontibacillus halophilus]|uniref:hypothetical protein n=1 Tax=Pontibacillus halophilus TaxID=516704 RepID=UPI0004095FBF|nr:hypothetical protein [Pontibacillus halophilus]
MTTIRKADFYYGSLLSVFINNGMAPAIVEPGENRRIYSVTTDNGEYEIYTKYVSSPGSRKNNHTKTWTFSFSTEEMERIKQYQDNGKKYTFAFVCGQHNKMQDSEIAILTLEQAKDCLDIGFQRESHRITVKAVKGKNGLRVYGTGRADKLEGKDNTLRIKRVTLPMIEGGVTIG